MAFVHWSITLVLSSYASAGCLGFEWTVHGGNPFPEVDRLALAGLWKLTPRIVPMKEFTVYPKQKKKRVSMDEDEDESSPPPENPYFLLMLNEDGSFQQCKSESNHLTNENLDVNLSWSRFQNKKKMKKNDDTSSLVEMITKGTWDFVDGKLIMAADRPPNNKILGKDSSSSFSFSSTFSEEDKLLVGRVVATYGQSLKDNPMLKKSSMSTQSSSTGSSTGSSSSSSSSSSTIAAAKQDESSRSNPAQPRAHSAMEIMDAHLSVPKGAIKTGRFMYPTRHPSFFELPMFKPKVKQWAFSLQQVLGSLNTKRQLRQGQQSIGAEIVKYQHSDFYNKTFLLTSSPLPQPRMKRKKSNGNSHQRWNDDDDAASDLSSPSIRVMQMVFHGNRTFSTVAGLGESIILRGKWDIVGQDHDQLWMQVWRFGFGRSVSGSTYSEGKFLTHEDAKSYWGTIRPMMEENPNNAVSSALSEALDERKSTTDTDDNTSTSTQQHHLEVKGSVLFGSGLEPLPVGLFIMREVTQPQRDWVSMDEEDDDEDDEMLQVDEQRTLLERLNNEASIDEARTVDDDDMEWPNNEAFQ